jgi:hypothetical protein
VEIRRIIDEAYARAKQILSDDIEELHLLAKGLLEHETLSGEIRQIIRRNPSFATARTSRHQQLAAACRAAPPARPGPLNPARRRLIASPSSSGSALLRLAECPR